MAGASLELDLNPEPFLAGMAAASAALKEFRGDAQNSTRAVSSSFRAMSSTAKGSVTAFKRMGVAGGAMAQATVGKFALVKSEVAAVKEEVLSLATTISSLKPAISRAPALSNGLSLGMPNSLRRGGTAERVVRGRVIDPGAGRGGRGGSGIFSGMASGMASAGAAAKRFLSSVGSAGSALNPFRVGLSAAGSALRGFRSSALGIGRSVSGSFRSIGSAANGSLSVLYRMRDAAATLNYIGNGIGWPVELAMGLESAQVRLRVLIGDAKIADKLFGQLYALAKENPVLELEDTVKAANALAGANMEPEKIAGFLANLAQASSTVEDFNGLASTTAQILNKGRVQTEELLQYAERGLSVFQDLQGVLKVDGATLNKMLEKGQVGWADLEKAIAKATAGSGRFAGMSGSIAKTTAGKFAQVKAEVKDLATTLGTPISDGLKPVLDDLRAYLPTLRDEVTAIGKQARDVGMGIYVAFKNGQLGPMIWEGLQLAGLKLLNLLGTGLVKIFDYLSKTIQAAMLSVASKIPLLGNLADDAAQAAADATEAGGSMLSGTYGADRIAKLEQTLAARKMGIALEVGNMVAKIEKEKAKNGDTGTRAARLKEGEAGGWESRLKGGVTGALKDMWDGMVEKAKLTGKAMGKAMADEMKTQSVPGAAAGAIDFRGQAEANVDARTGLPPMSTRDPFSAAGRAGRIVQEWKQQAPSNKTSWQDFLGSNNRIHGLNKKQVDWLRTAGPESAAARFSNAARPAKVDAAKQAAEREKAIEKEERALVKAANAATVEHLPKIANSLKTGETKVETR